jgi:hypothetical protein
MRGYRFPFWPGVAALVLALSLGCSHTERLPPDAGGPFHPPGNALALGDGRTPSSYRVWPAMPASRALVAPSRPVPDAPTDCVVTRVELPAAPERSACASAELLPVTWANHPLVGAMTRRADWQLAEPVSSRSHLAELQRPRLVLAADPGDSPREVSPASPREPIRVPALTVDLSAPPPHREPPVRTPSQPGFARAADFTWLVGVLVHGDARDTWSVRYAAAGEGDRYEGLLTLVGQGPMTGFRPGQLVRVEGDLIDPAPHEIKPGYRVRAMQSLRRP